MVVRIKVLTENLREATNFFSRFSIGWNSNNFLGAADEVVQWPTASFPMVLSKMIYFKSIHHNDVP